MKDEVYLLLGLVIILLTIWFVVQGHEYAHKEIFEHYGLSSNLVFDYANLRFLTVPDSNVSLDSNVVGQINCQNGCNEYVGYTIVPFLAGFFCLVMLSVVYMKKRRCI